MKKSGFRNNMVIIAMGVVILIGIFLIYSLSMNYRFQNQKEQENYIALKENFIKVQMNRTIEMNDIYLKSETPRYQSQIEKIAMNIDNHQQWIDGLNDEDILVEKEGRRQVYQRQLAIIIIILLALTIAFFLEN